MTGRHRAPWAAAALVLVGAVPPGGAPAPVHTSLTGTFPAADTTHTIEIREVRLRFSGPVQMSLTSIEVTGPTGPVRTGALASVEGSGEAEIRVPLDAPLPSGDYTVAWATAGPDSHVIRGTYGFSVDLPVQEQEPDTAAARPPAEPVAQVGPTPATSEATVGPSLRTAAVGWLFLVSLVGMIGTVAFRLAVVGPFGRVEEHAEAAARLRRGVTGLAWLALVAGLATLPLRLAGQARAVAGPDGSAWAATGSVLASTWGSGWVLEVSGALLFLVGLLVARSRPEARRPWLVCALGALLVALVPGLSGHATAGGAPWMAVHTAHVLGTGVWLGGLACLVLVGIPSTARAAELSTLSPLVTRFSAVALPTVAVIVVTGVLNTTDRIALGDVFTSGYGRTLLLKLVVVAAALALGFYNWRVVRPELASSGRPGLLRIPATLEMLVGLLVLAVTAVLVVTALP